MLNVKEICEITSGKLLNGDYNIIPENYDFDSRRLEKKHFFVPIKGEKIDGHEYIIESVNKGIIGFLIQSNYINKEQIIRESININKNIIIIEVEDNSKAFFEMGKANRNKHINIPIIAITGSVGKTSTREIIATTLEEKYNVLRTFRNFNNYYGIPYMLLKMDKQDFCVIEIGIDSIGEMENYTKAVKPDVVVITNIGFSHIEKFGTIKNTYKEKIKICEGLNINGICIVNGDDEKLIKINNDYKGNILKYGVINDDKYKVKSIKTSIDKTIFEIENNNKKEIVTINDIGNHNILNAMAAIKVGEHFNMKIKEIIKGISKYKNFDQRMKSEKIKNNSIIINDAYNASYDSAVSGLKTIEKMPFNKKIVIIGDLLELGEHSEKIHSKIGKIINSSNINVVITFGEESKNIYKEIDNNIKKYIVSDKEKILDIIDKELKENTLIYIKASNGMKLCEISDKIISKYKKLTND